MESDTAEILKSSAPVSADGLKVKGKAGKHVHLAYRSQDGAVIVSQTLGHTHEPVADSAGSILLVSAADGHFHKVEGVVEAEEEKPKKDEEKTLVEDVHRLFQQAKDFESKFRELGEESEGFYDGTGQWRKGDTDKLDGKQRASLTINEIEPKIDLLRGYQSQNRYDYRFFPTEEGDATVADILNIVVKNITEQNNADYEESWAFEDQTIVGRGLLDALIDFDKNIEGDIVIERFPWKDAYLGEHEKITLEDLEGMVKTRWFSLPKLRQMWPDKAEKINKALDLFLGDDSMAREQDAIDGSSYPTDGGFELPMGTDFINIARKEFRVLEAWQKVYKRVPVLVLASDDAYINAYGWDNADIDAAVSMGFKKIDRRVTEMRVTTVAGGQLLEDTINEDFDGDFSIVALYAKKRGRRIWGKIEPVKDCQREINKRQSQYVDIMNKAVAYGYFYDDQTFANPQEEERFKKNSTTPGFTVKLQNINNKPLREEGVKYPSEVVNMIQLSSSKLKEIMNINAEMLGQSSNIRTGVALAQQKQAGLLGNEFLFDNLALGKRLLGRKIVSLIQKHFTPQRILRILKRHGDKQEEPLMVNGQPFDQYPEEDILQLLETQDLTKYDVIVGQAAHSPSARSANFLLWTEMAMQGVQVPPQLLIDLSDLPDKKKALGMISEMAQQAAAENKQKYDTEIQKSMIAQQGKAEQLTPQ